MTVLPGRRDEGIALLTESTLGMPGCSSYGIAKDISKPDVLWVTEVWDSEASHDASFTLRAVQDVIPRVKPLVAQLEKIALTEPVTARL
jgi:quinol monooxygenase YgiN